MVNKVTRVTSKTTMTIDPIIIDRSFKSNCKSLIFKKYNFNNFHLTNFNLPLRNPSTKKEPTFIYKRIVSDDSEKLYETYVTEIETCKNQSNVIKWKKNILLSTK